MRTIRPERKPSGAPTVNDTSADRTGGTMSDKTRHPDDPEHRLANAEPATQPAPPPWEDNSEEDTEADAEADDQ